MSGRRLILPASLAAALILCIGCQSRPNAGATSAAPTASKASGNAPTSVPKAHLAATTGQDADPPASRPSRPSRPCGFRPSRLP